MNERLVDGVDNERLKQSIEIANILRDLDKKFDGELGFDQETCEEIADAPFEEAFETAYSYLVQAGLDPEEVLSDFLEEPKNEA